MIEDTVLIALIMGIAQVIKQFRFPVKFMPLINLVLGVAGSMMWGVGSDWRAALFNGLMVGVTATGLFSGVKNIIEGIREGDDR
jgi:uncharacterized membrane protein YfbV (UPF0208 family)